MLFSFMYLVFVALLKPLVGSGRPARVTAGADVSLVCGRFRWFLVPAREAGTN
jgi:hypothetical protein